MKKGLIIIALCFGIFTKTFACLNGSNLKLTDSTFLSTDLTGSIPYGYRFRGEDDLTKILFRIDSLYKKTKNIDYLSDKGLVLILLKRYDDAIKLYLKLEKTNPYRYSTASNLGTAYELIGQNERALMWITKAVQIDSTSHDNSEWIHMNILKAKIQGKDYDYSKSLLNTSFGNDSLPTSNLTQVELQKLSDALFYQLNERVSFVNPKDEIVAQLMFELGNIAILLNKLSDAWKDYEIAEEYGFTGNLINERKRQIILLTNPALRNTNISSNLTGNPFNTKNAAYLVIGAIFLVMFGYWLVKKIIQKQTQKN